MLKTFKLCQVNFRYFRPVHRKKGTVETEQLGSVSLIGINRPECRNAVDPPTAKLLYEAFKKFEDDKDSLVAVLHGKGGHFCAGYDLKAFSSADASSLAPIAKTPEQGEMGPMGPSRMMFTKPVIAAVSGYAVAGGLELALMCDIRVVEESAVMGIFCRRFGVPMVDGGMARLPQLIGLSRALDMILTGRPVDAKEALDMGLANRIVSTGTALGNAVQIASTIARYPQKCMNTDRMSAYYSTYSAKSLQDALQYEFVNGIKVLSEESIPGATRFSKGVGRHGSFDEENDPKS